jgi:hypothetical protein
MCWTDALHRPLKECVMEVVAADVGVLRVDGSTREVALAAVDPDHPLMM